jgi:hypothetical protein
VAVALVHHPVLDRRGDEVTTAVTNLDVHDIARTARTYGVTRFYVVTPVEEQGALVERLLDHWRRGFGASYNPDRREALELVETVATVEEALTRWESFAGEPAVPVLTGAGRTDGISFARCRQLSRTRPLLIALGTGWGLAPCLFEQGWTVLSPVAGVGGYNHLPVRAAAAIILDRLFGRGSTLEVTKRQRRNQ